MAIAENSYGSVSGVAVLVPRYANTSVAFDLTTRPVLAVVENQIDQISGLVNAILAEAGFSIPVYQVDVRMALDFFVTQEVAAIVEGINGSGRFGPTSKSEGKKGRFALIMDDVKAFIEANTIGFERMGATRSYSATSGLAFRDTDERGNATFPIFQRDSFGAAWTDWDSD
jgi:hypothetical protein